MAIQVFIRDAKNDAARPELVSSSVTLSGADEVMLAAGSPNVLHVEKRGSNLAVSFEDQQELALKDFFVIGPEGDFNQLLTFDGKVVATALTAPEAEPDDFRPDSDPSTAAVVGTETTASSDGLPDLENVDSQVAINWLAGTGLAYGFGSMLESQSDDGDDSEAVTKEAAAFASEVDALLGAPAAGTETGEELTGATSNLRLIFDDSETDGGQQVSSELDDQTLFAGTNVMPIDTIAEFDPLVPFFDEVDL